MDVALFGIRCVNLRKLYATTFAVQQQNETKAQLFARRLISRRNARGVGQKDLADSVGVALRTLQYWEAGKTIPHGETLQRLAQNLASSIHDLLGDEERPALRDQLPTSSEERCLEHLRMFLRTCQGDSSKIAWTLIELQDHFPLGKWTRAERLSYQGRALPSKPPRQGPDSEPASPSPDESQSSPLVLPTDAHIAKQIGHGAASLAAAQAVQSIVAARKAGGPTEKASGQSEGVPPSSGSQPASPTPAPKKRAS